MAELIKMPKMSDTMEEGVIAKWLKKPGDQVRAGDIIAEIETDKATLELESFEDGTLLYLAAEERNSVPVGEIIAIIGTEGENIDELIKNIDLPKPEAKTLETDHMNDHAGGGNARPVTPEADTSDIPASVVTMPKMSDTMTEGTIVAWHKKVGEEVKTGDILAEIETDKATMELESYEDGFLLYQGVKEGDSVPVDAVIAIVGEKDADYKKLLQLYTGKTEIKEPEGEKPDVTAVPEKRALENETKTTAGTISKETSTEPGTRVKASPLARKLAGELGYDIGKIKGSGENGRIVKRDVENYSPQVIVPDAGANGLQVPVYQGKEHYEDQPVSQMRKTIARRLAESKFTAPHFYLTMEINMDRAVSARESMNGIAPVKISYNDMVIKAVASALRRHPDVNVSWLGDRIRRYTHIHIGVAVAINDGLVVPVVRFADTKPLAVISAEVKQLSEKARNRQLQPGDWEGNTFTISNLGMFGIEEFTAIINPPDACILAVGGISEIPVVREGAIVPGNVMKVTMSCDHRAVDGATGAAFLKTLKLLLEDPVRLLV